MYLAIDIGGTKTLLALFDQTGTLIKQLKFPTPHDYPGFLQALKDNYTSFQAGEVSACVAAVPGLLDHDRNIAIAFGNLSWQNLPIRQDISDIVGVAVKIENDTKLAALSEARLIKEEFARVLYITVSTGISAGLVINGDLDTGMIDSESGQMLIEKDGKLMAWEDIASGRAIVERYGMQASDITDEATWKLISQDLAVGVFDLIATIQPEVIIFGGGVGAHFDKFGHLLEAELKQHETPMVKIPALREAINPEHAVIYGCYQYMHPLT